MITFNKIHIPIESRFLRALLHVGFWLFFIVLILGTKDNVTAKLVLTWLTVLSVSACVVYINLYYLIPSFFSKSSYWIYFLSIVIAIAGGAVVIELFKVFNYYAIEVRFIDSLKNLLIFIIITSSFRFFKESISKQVLLSKLEKKQMQTELSMLKLQVNPHFLFNTLNNLYAINLENHDKANEMILQLANFLRTQLVVSEKPFVLLKDEINIVKNYIDLEKIRLYNCEVSVDLPDDFDNLMFPSLLLLPLVENAFKHGMKYFRFRVQIDDKYFSFETENGIRPNKKIKKDGVGLSNVTKRLKLIFHENYFLEKKIEDKKFYLFLRINQHCLTNDYLRYRTNAI